MFRIRHLTALETLREEHTVSTSRRSRASPMAKKLLEETAMAIDVGTTSSETDPKEIERLTLREGNLRCQNRRRIDQQGEGGATGRDPDGHFDAGSEWN